MSTNNFSSESIPCQSGRERGLLLLESSDGFTGIRKYLYYLYYFDQLERVQYTSDLIKIF